MSSKLFSEIERLVPTLDGWCSVERAIDLAATVLAVRPPLSVSLGVWGGRDTLAMALAHKHLGMGRVIAIDPWSAQASVEGQDGANAEWWSKQDMHDLVCGRFMHNVDLLGLNNIVLVERKRSDEVEPPPEIGLLVIDGNHSSQAIKDVARFAPRVRVGGMCYADDIGWSGGGVAQAVDDLVALGFAKLYERDTGAMFQRVEMR